MIASITGIVQAIGKDSLVILVGGLGIRVFVPRIVLEQAHQGRSISLHTHLQLRENDVSLYGFPDEQELELFGLLLDVSGVGPKLALAVLSTLSADLLTGAVSREEPEVLQRVPGIGKKTAQRVLFHLRDRLKQDFLPAGLDSISDIDTEVIAALTALGYSVVEAQAAIQSLPRDAGQELEERIRMALSRLGS